MESQADNTRKDLPTSSKGNYSCSKTQACVRHYQAQPSPWETKLDTLLGSVQLVSSSTANRSDVTASSSDRNEATRHIHQNRREHGGNQVSPQPTPRPVRSQRRASLTIKTNQAWHPPCQPREVGDVCLQSMRGSIEYVSATEKVVFADASRFRQMGDTVSSNNAMSLTGAPSVMARSTSALTGSNVSSFSHFSHSRSNSTAASLTFGKLTLSQRLQTMDVQETIECLREQGYTTTFIAEHLSVRGYRIAPGETVGVYRKYYKWWVQEYLDKGDQ